MMFRKLTLIAFLSASCIVSSLQAWIGSSTLPFQTSLPRNTFSTHFLPGRSRSSVASSPSSKDSHNFNDVPKNITELAEKKVRLARAQAEIDRILNSPVDPPFDAEAELQKVVSISPPLISEDSPEGVLEQQVSSMEEELYKAVKETDFTKAAAQSKAISQMHIDDCGLVLQVNSKFYKAFSRKNMEDMRQIWLNDKSCVCIHPSLKPLFGIKEIHDSFDRMFQSSNGSFQKSWMEPHEIRVTVKATTAVITCDEWVYARRFVRGKKRQTELINKLQATNIFRKIGSKWYMTYHHSSWHAESDAAKYAIQKQGGSSSSSSSKTRDDEDETSEIDRILGVNNFGPLLGDGSAGESDEKPVKRVIMGSLSDILNGNLGGLLGGEEGEGKGDDGLGSSDGGAIIHFSQIGDDEDSEDEDDDEEEDVETFDQIQDWAQKDDKKKLAKTSPKDPSKSTKSERQRSACISALRRLASNGRISPNQKRVLLTDIINSSAKGEMSMVEVAYDLLFSQSEGEEENEDAEDEFADQCIIFAKTFEENMYR